jgi:hypothetical protein
MMQRGKDKRTIKEKKKDMKDGDVTEMIPNRNSMCFPTNMRVFVTL